MIQELYRLLYGTGGKFTCAHINISETPMMKT